MLQNSLDLVINIDWQIVGINLVKVLIVLIDWLIQTVTLLYIMLLFHLGDITQYKTKGSDPARQSLF